MLHPQLALLQQQMVQQQILQQQMQQMQAAAAADPRVQQALQADPRLTPGSAGAYPFSPDPRLQALFNPFGAFSPFASAASSMSSPAPGGVWTPPVVTTAASTNPSTPPPSTIAPPRQSPSSLGSGTPSRLPPSLQCSSLALAARLASPSLQ